MTSLAQFHSAIQMGGSQEPNRAEQSTATPSIFLDLLPSCVAPQRILRKRNEKQKRKGGRKERERVKMGGGLRGQGTD